ncbi:MAG: hypothetical protein WD847_15360 [Pirellulales bacterium]
MPRLLALEWDSREVRIAVASAKAGQSVIEHAFAVSLPARLEGQSGTGDTRTAESIGQALASLRLGRAETLVAVGRASIELKQLTLPPAPADELPDMVRFQAMREFTSLAEGWPLDFLPLGAGTDGPRQVLAAAISPDLVEQISETCSRAGVAPERLVLRPCAAASLLCRTQSGGERVRLLVDVLAEEADLTVLVDDQVVFLRTARLPADVLTASDECRPLLAEMRRTIAAAQNQLGGQKVEAIDLCGSGQDHAALAERMSRELGLPARLFDPFAGLDLSKSLRRSLPQHTGRFAPLLGMLLDEAQQIPPAIDFLNPRRRPPPPSRRNRYALAGVSAALLALVAAGWAWLELSAMDRDIKALRAQSKDMDPLVDEATRLEQATAEIEKWTAKDVSWLDEMVELSRDFPPAEDAMLTDLTMNPSNPEGGKIALNGLVHNISVVDALEDGLRDEDHRVGGHGLGALDSPVDRYTWEFSSTVDVRPQTKDDYLKRAKEKQKVPADKEPSQKQPPDKQPPDKQPPSQQPPLAAQPTEGPAQSQPAPEVAGGQPPAAEAAPAGTASPTTKEGG